MKTTDIIERLKVELRVSNERQLAQRLGIPVPTVYEWKRRGRIPPGGLARIAVAIGRSVEWVRTGQPSALEIATETARVVEATPGASERATGPALRMKPLIEAFEGFPLGSVKALDTVIEVVRYIKDAGPEERELISMLLAILRGRNRENVEAIKSNIKAFYKSREMDSEPMLPTQRKAAG